MARHLDRPVRSLTYSQTYSPVVKRKNLEFQESWPKAATPAAVAASFATMAYPAVKSVEMRERNVWGIRNPLHGSKEAWLVVGK